jgi:hypothetical protein
MKQLRIVNLELCIFMVAAVLVALGASNLFAYWNGLTNGKVPFLLDAFLMLAGAVLTVALPIASFARPGLSGKRRMVGMGLTVLLLALWVALFGRWLPVEAFEAGFDVWLTRNLNTAGIRAWQTAPTTPVGPVGIVVPPWTPWLTGWTPVPAARWPAAVRAANPSELWQEPGGTGLVLVWGSGGFIAKPMRMVYVGPTASGTLPAKLDVAPCVWTPIGANVHKCLLQHP